MTNENKVEMCKIQQKHFLHNLLSIKENEIETDKMDNLIYRKIGNQNRECFKVELKGIKKFKTSTIQFLLYVLHQATTKNLNVNDRILYLNPIEYKGYKNLKNQDSLRDKINADLKTLINLHLEFNDLVFYTDRFKCKHSKEIATCLNICSITSSYKRKIISIAFTPEFIEYYRSLPCMEVPKEIFSIDTRRNPNALSLLWRLATLKHMNKTKSNNGIVSVTNLLNHCTSIPTYQQIKSNGQVKQRIIAPFERDLNSLDCLEWCYLDEKNNVVNNVKDYCTFVNLKIAYGFVGKEEKTSLNW